MILFSPSLGSHPFFLVDPSPVFQAPLAAVLLGATLSIDLALLLFYDLEITTIGGAIILFVYYFNLRLFIILLWLRFRIQCRHCNHVSLLPLGVARVTLAAILEAVLLQGLLLLLERL